jgi:phosphoglycolate phosphatase
VIGLGLHDCPALTPCPNLPEEQLSALMVERYRHHYLSHDHELQLFDGAAAMIAELAAAGFLLAVATGKSRIGLDRALRTVAWAVFSCLALCRRVFFQAASADARGVDG